MLIEYVILFPCLFSMASSTGIESSERDTYFFLERKIRSQLRFNIVLCIVNIITRLRSDNIYYKSNKETRTVKTTSFTSIPALPLTYKCVQGCVLYRRISGKIVATSPQESINMF